MMKKLLCSIILAVFTIGFVNAQGANGDISGGTPLDVIATTSTAPPTNTPSAAEGTDFGTVTAGTNSAANNFVFTSSVATTFSVSAVLEPGLDAGEFQVSAPIPNPISGVGATSTFPITFQPDAGSTVGSVKQAVVRVSVGAPPFGPFEDFFFTIQGTVGSAAPSIEVFDNENNPLVSGATTIDPYGNAVGSAETITRSYTIENNGTAPLTIQGITFAASSPEVAFFTNFPVGTSFPFDIAPNGGSFTFDVNFTPPQPDDPGDSNVNYTAFLAIDTETADAPNPFTDPTDFFFQVTGTGTVPTPSIELFGNGNTISGNDSNVPSDTNHTFFGDVEIDGGSIVRTYTIVNNGTSDLVLNGIPVVRIDDDAEGNFSVTQQPLSTTIAAGGGFTTFQVTFDPNSPVLAGLKTAEINIENNASPDPYVFDISGNATQAVNEPEMDVLDNSNAALASGGSVDFGSQDVSTGSQTFTFTIQNNGTQDLNLTDPSPFVTISGTNAGDFTLGTIPASTITATNSTTFTITFDPSATGTRNATVSIANNDSDENPYTFSLTGEGIDNNAGSPLLITQYYENGANDVIEIKNISSSNVNPLFFVCVYEDLSTTTGVINTSAPNQSVSISSVLAPGDVITINSLSFDGNDVILISTSDGTDSYDARIDIVGVVGSTTPPFWGANTSFIKGCGTNESPSLNFGYDLGTDTVTDYIELATSEVDSAPSNTNLFLGTQTVGPTTYTSSWGNGIPDKTKNAIINGTYSAGSGSFETCDLTINAAGNVDFSGSTTNFVKVNNNLAINGSFTLGDNAALVTVDENATITGAITKQESTTTLNNSFDFTYWSSPVQGATTDVFAPAPSDRIFQWYKPSSGDSGGWEAKSGALEQARGYISEAPDGSTQHNISFTGTPYNGIVPITVGFDNTLPNGGGGFNLVGNPYPCAIDADTFILLSDNEDIDNGPFDGTLWFWTHGTAYQDNPGTDGDYVVDDYVTYNLVGGSSPGVTNNIGSSQAFFVNAKSAGPIFFTNEMKLDGQNTQFFRGNNKSTVEKDRMWLNVTSKQGRAYNEILIGFMDNATDGEDRGYDGVKYSGGNYVSLYSTIGDKRFAIQGLGSFSAEKRINIGFDAWVQETFTISIREMEGVLNTEEIYLVDNYLNIVHDLKTSSYEFEITETGSFSDRFTLQFNKSVLGVDEELLNNSFIVSSDEDELRVRASESVANIKVYDMLGRLLIDSNPKQSEFTLNTNSIAKGTVLVLNATLENGVEISKKAIKF